MSGGYRGTKYHIIEWEDDFIHDLHFISLATVWQGQSLQFVNTNTFLDTKLFNTDTFSVLKKTNYYTSSSSGIRDVFGTLKLILVGSQAQLVIWDTTLWCWPTCSNALPLIFVMFDENVDAACKKERSQHQETFLYYNFKKEFQQLPTFNFWDKTWRRNSLGKSVAEPMWIFINFCPVITHFINFYKHRRCS